MSEQTSSKVPQMRLKGFDRAWEDKPIGEVLAEKKRPLVLKDHQRYELITVKRRNEGVVSRGHLFGRDILVKNYSQLQTGDFVISKRQVVHGATGIIPPKLDGAIVSNEYLVAVNSNSLLTRFLTILASLPNMRQKFFLSSYGVDIEKLFFDAEDWKKRNVIIPGITEQTQIYEYFQELDSLIGLHQRKHDKLVTLKKAMLQKMFPQPGTTIPEIRFKGFEAEWMVQKLEDVCYILNGYAFKSTDFDSAQKNKVIRMSDLKSGSISKEDHALVSEYVVAGLERFSLKHGDLLFGMSGSLSNYAWVMSEDLPAYLNQRVGCIRKKGDNIAQFVQYIYLSENTQKIISASAVGAAQLNISSAFLANISVYIPHPTEQQKIGSYFRTLDGLISQHATQLQKLQQIKSACLERMFV